MLKAEERLGVGSEGLFGWTPLGSIHQAYPGSAHTARAAADRPGLGEEMADTRHSCLLSQGLRWVGGGALSAKSTRMRLTPLVRACCLQAETAK